MNQFMSGSVQYKGQIYRRVYETEREGVPYFAGYEPKEGDVLVDVVNYYGDPDEWPVPPPFATEEDIAFIEKNYEKAKK